MSGDQVKAAFQGAHRYDLGIIGAGVLAFIFSLLPYYTASFDGGPGFSVSEDASAWHGFFGWFAALCALAAAVLVALSLLRIPLQFPLRLVVLALFGVATICVVLALFVIPGGDCQGIQACEDAVDFGHGIGYWLSLIVIVAGTALAFLRKDATD
jgi:hypothetical protein